MAEKKINIKYRMKKTYWGILLVTVIFIFSLIPKMDTKEAFTPQFQNCRDQGYTKEFCNQTPVSAYGPSSCTCSDGKLGRIIPGFGGKCICLY
jgi:hypothetical protein